MSGMPTWFCISPLLPNLDREALWDAKSPVERWRYLHRSTIRNELVLARTSYLNADPKAAKRRVQKVLLSIRRTRPELVNSHTI
jgi:hypothetical protein